MKISIVTATLNEADALRRALQSVADQHYPELEHIVIDGMSTDGTREVVGEFPGVKFVEREPRGVYDALNYGFGIAGGDILGFVHGNDLMPEEDILQEISRQFESHPDLDFIYGDMRYVKPATRKHVRIYYAGNFHPSQIKGGVVPPHPTLYIRAQAFRKVGLYRLDMPNAADFDYWIRIFNDKSLTGKYLPRVLAEMSTGGRSTAFLSRIWFNNLEKLKALRLNGLPANPLRLLFKYFTVVKNLFIVPKYER